MINRDSTITSGQSLKTLYRFQYQDLSIPRETLLADDENMSSSIEYGCLDVGIHVDIQRTDGRIHQAVVTGLAPETSSVTVEWYEKGETKGKEVELEMIQLLNPELFNNIANNANGVGGAGSNGVKSPAEEAPPAASPVEPTPRQQPREIPRPSGPGVFKAPAPRG